LIGLPASWTDVVPVDPIVVAAMGRAHFRAEDKNVWSDRPTTPHVVIREVPHDHRSHP
jgi:hypothetical protein